ncbi:MAG: MFS transporter, partial [Micromonosporaceae bacterium]|nr:MFS transporter [Micromonosporaceae bacterium]
LAALVVFAAGSLACAYASSPPQLIAARLLLGLGAAFILPLGLAMVSVLFAEHERQRALAFVAGAAVASYPLGPLLGGWLLTHYWWGSVFLINLPLILPAIGVLAIVMPESRATRLARLDLAGAAVSAIGLGTGVYGLIRAGEQGWGDHWAIGCMVIGCCVLGGFVVLERAVAARGNRGPLVDLGLFRSRGFAWGTVLAMLVTFSTIGLLFVVPQYLGSVLGFDAMETGIRLLPMIAGMMVGLGLGDRCSARLSPAITSAAGFALIAAGFSVGATTDPGDGTAFLASWITVVGVGFGIALPATANAAIETLAAERSGAGSAVFAAIRQVGGAFGVAVLGSVLNTAYRDHLSAGDGLPPAAIDQARDSVSAGMALAGQLDSPPLLEMVEAAFTHGMDVTLAASAAIALAGAGLALAFLRAPGGGTSNGESQSRCAPMP